MTDEELDRAADLFIDNQIREKHGWTFYQFLKVYEKGLHNQLLDLNAS